MAECGSGVRKLSEAVFRKIDLRKIVPLRPLNFRTPYLPLNLNIQYPVNSLIQ